jgi:hypothetical protein
MSTTSYGGVQSPWCPDRLVALSLDGCPPIGGQVPQISGKRQDMPETRRDPFAMSRYLRNSRAPRLAAPSAKFAGVDIRAHRALRKGSNGSFHGQRRTPSLTISTSWWQCRLAVNRS